MKVFVVTSGEYSDYHIERIFSTRELAEQFVVYDDYARVEEWDIDEAPIRFGKRVLVTWFSARDDEREWDEGWVEGYEREVTVEEGDTFMIRDGQKVDGHTITVRASTFEHARKVLGERKARYLAGQV